MDTIQSVAWRGKSRKACLSIIETGFETQPNWAQIQLLISQCVAELLPQVCKLCWELYLFSSAGIIHSWFVLVRWEEKSSQFSLPEQHEKCSAWERDFWLMLSSLKILSQCHLHSTDLLKTWIAKNKKVLVSRGAQSWDVNAACVHPSVVASVLSSVLGFFMVKTSNSTKCVLFFNK